jgi:hypothetical protein
MTGAEALECAVARAKAQPTVTTAIIAAFRIADSCPEAAAAIKREAGRRAAETDGQVSPALTIRHARSPRAVAEFFLAAAGSLT